MRQLRHRHQNAHGYLRRELHVGVGSLERVLAVRRQALPLLRRRQEMGVVLRQRLRVDQRLRSVLGVELPRVLLSADGAAASPLTLSLRKGCVTAA